MGTSFDEIYERALFKFKDRSFLNYTEELKDLTIKNYLLSAIVDFQHSCKTPLTYTEIPPEDQWSLAKYYFDNDLTEEEMQILSTGIVFHWLSSKVAASEHLKNVILNSDYKSFSQGAMLKELKEYRAEIRDEYYGKIKSYSFRYSDLANLRPNRGG